MSDPYERTWTQVKNRLHSTSARESPEKWEGVISSSFSRLQTEKEETLVADEVTAVSPCFPRTSHPTVTQTERGHADQAAGARAIAAAGLKGVSIVQGERAVPPTAARGREDPAGLTGGSGPPASAGAPQVQTGDLEQAGCEAQAAAAGASGGGVRLAWGQQVKPGCVRGPASMGSYGHDRPIRDGISFGRGFPVGGFRRYAFKMKLGRSALRRGWVVSTGAPDGEGLKCPRSGPKVTGGDRGEQRPRASKLPEDSEGGQAWVVTNFHRAREENPERVDQKVPG